jgi:hypothetical protein
MADNRETLESRVSWLEERVNQLEQRLVAQNDSPITDPALKMKEAQTPAGAEGEDASEDLLTWVGRSSLLPRISTLCFLLVVALALRTVTDNDLLDKQVGSLIGMFYAGFLIAWGAHRYRLGSPLAPVFTLCGMFLLASVVVETHAHFASLPAIPAYLILTVAGAGAAAISYFQRVALPVFAGTLGMSIGGIAIDYPSPIFTYLAAVLLASNLFAVFATRLQRCSWLRWILLGLTLTMFTAWAFKLVHAVNRFGLKEVPFELAGFMPWLALFALVYLGFAIMGVVWSGEERVARFDLGLPVLSAGSAFLLARYVIYATHGNETVLGVIGVGAAAVLIGIAQWLSSRRSGGATGTTAFVLAGAMLLALALPLATGQEFVALTLLSAGAFGLALIAQRWQRGGVRVTSYLLQLYACVTLVLELYSTKDAEPSVVSALAAGALACIGLSHYRWARRHAPPATSFVFSRFDQEDRSAVLLLLGALVSGFFTLRVGIYQGLIAAGITGPGAFGCYQSVLINLSAIVLMVLALLRRNRELRNVAVLVTIVGGCKVFFGDMLAARGLPLVFSVFSFGLAAAIGSVVLGRWQRQAVEAAPDTPAAEPREVKEA